MLLEGGNPVRDGLNAGQRGAAVREGCEQQKECQWLHPVPFCNLDLIWAGGRRGTSIDVVMKEAVADHEKKAENENVGRCGKECSRFTYAPQVCDRNESDKDQAEKNLVVVQPCVACPLHH